MSELLPLKNMEVAGGNTVIHRKCSKSLIHWSCLSQIYKSCILNSHVLLVLFPSAHQATRREHEVLDSRAVSEASDSARNLKE